MKTKKKIWVLFAIILFMGITVFPKSVFADEGHWVKSENRWWYQNDDGTYPALDWLTDNGKKYYFDEEGWMVTGWQKIDGKWYLFSGSGAMQTGWHWVGEKCYYLAESGIMAEDTWIDGYYVDASGAWVPGKTMEEVQQKAGWVSSGNRWWYRHADGSYTQSGWEKINGKWYYFDEEGWMVTGWQKIGGEWYYLASSGAMLTGWQQIGGTWYYLTASGAMAANTWIDGYYVDTSGAWIPNPGGTGKKIIAIDAGHQRYGNSSKEPIGPGSSEMKAKVSSGTYGKWSGLYEYELNLQVAMQLKDELQARGYVVYMTRESHDVDISNAQRALNAANAGADILVRIHANGDDNSSVYGALTMAPSNSNSFLSGSLISSSQKLSQKIIDCFCQATGAKNRGVMTTDTMSGINWSKIPVTIIEMGFMTNQTEDLNMASSSYQKKMVQGIANGIDQYYAS
ncbi:N-acetylmuramoyl-L-alanine amidase [bacterium]|nr:N-acetylmuramoyl-L-alanine amidase [bacterium]MDY3023068.1 N-acetylmuramoyl-L-alanine amidase [Oliverpabstia sp.]